MRLQDQSTKSEPSKVKMDLKQKDTVVKDLQVMFSRVVEFHAEEEEETWESWTGKCSGQGQQELVWIVVLFL